MAAPAPLLPIVIPPAPANNPAFDDDPVYLPGGHPLVTATSSFMSWQPVAAAAGAQAQQVSAPFHVLLYALGIRFKVSPLPADVAAARAINIFTLRFTAAYWTRALSELCASGLAPPGTTYDNVAELHSVISGLVIQNPIMLNITANDWNASAAFASPGAAPAQAAARARFAEVAFLSVAPITALEISVGPRAQNAPWAAIALLAGALGPVGRNHYRFAASGASVLVAAEIRGNSTAQDVVLASSLRQVLVNAILPSPFRSHSPDQASVLGEFRAGLQYRTSDDAKAAVEEERISYIGSWFPTIARAVLALGQNEGQTVGALRMLQKAMLPPEFHTARLSDVFDRLETQLTSRTPTINAALAKANPTLNDVTAALLAENAIMAPVGSSAANPVVGQGAPGGGADTDGIALSRQPFKDVEAVLGALDLSSEQGQRNAITAILAKGECILAIRILLHPNHKSSDAASSRNATCIAINSLRPQLHNYFNYALRVDTSGPTSFLPPYMLHYSFATATGREEADTLIAQLLRFEFDHMNFFGAPHGAGTWAQHVSASTAAETVATVNRFIQPSNIERIKSFVAILLGSLGLPQSLPIAQGYTWPAFVEFYSAKLQLARQLPLLLDQYEHLAQCSQLFEAALTAMRHRLVAVVRDPNPAGRTMQVALFPPDSSIIQNLNTIAAEIVRKRTVRGDLAGAFVPHKGQAPVANWETLRLDDPFFVNHMKSAKKARVGDSSGSLTFGMDALDVAGDVPANSTNPNGLAPGSLAASWRWHHNRMIISGLSWDVAALAKHLGVPARGVGAPCWPFVLADCHDKNRMARCGFSAKPGHEQFGSTAHALAKDFDRAAMTARFSTQATPEEKAGLVTTPAGKGRGKGAGKGGRGRGERGRGRQGALAQTEAPDAAAAPPPAQLALPAPPVQARPVAAVLAENAAMLSEIESLKRRLSAVEQPDAKDGPQVRAVAAGARQTRFAGEPLYDAPNFEQPPQGEPPAGGQSTRLSTERNFRLGVGDVTDDLAVNPALARLLKDLPTARQNPLSATNLRELQSPLKTLTNAMSAQGKFVVDCGGHGQCGPNTLSYLLGLVDLAVIDGPQLRLAVVNHVQSAAHRARITQLKDQQGRFYSLEGLILRCLEDDSGSIPSPLLTVESWCHHIAQPASWTDLAFLQVAADRYQVAISIHTVDDLSTVGHLGVILPCQHRRPLALIEVGMWMGRHLVAVVTADGSAARAVPVHHDDSDGRDAARATYPGSDRAPPRAVPVHHDDSDSRDATRATYPESDRAPPPAQRRKPSPSGSIQATPPPLTLDEVRALLRTGDTRWILVACEFSGALTGALWAAGYHVISCDLRPALHRFPHYRGDMRDIVGLCRWERAYFFPSCYQHLRGDEHCLPLKIHDCRAFWAGAVVLWCLACPHADIVVVEQPDTIVYDYIPCINSVANLYEFRTSEFGDPAEYDKFIRLAVRADLSNATLRAPTHMPQRQTDRPDHSRYVNAEARDRARSSWEHHKLTCQALIDLRLEPNQKQGEAVTYLTLLRSFASSWYRSGHPVPIDYLNQDAQPTDPAWRSYQSVRGPGDGRRPTLIEPQTAPFGDGGWDDGPGDVDLVLNKLDTYAVPSTAAQQPSGTPPQATQPCGLCASAH